MPTQAQLEANRLNAKKSTGPTSAEGKEISRMNAVTHGITARLHLLPGEDPEEFTLLAGDYQRAWKPVGADEVQLVDTLIRADWHQRRFDRIEGMVIQDAMDPTLSGDAALAKLFSETRNNPFSRLLRARAAVRRDWCNALKQLQKLQKERQAERTSESAPAPSAENGKTNPIPAETSANRPAAAPPNGPVSAVEALK